MFVVSKQSNSLATTVIRTKPSPPPFLYNEAIAEVVRQNSLEVIFSDGACRITLLQSVPV
jgi:hypothetical protein